MYCYPECNVENRLDYKRILSRVRVNSSQRDRWRSVYSPNTLKVIKEIKTNLKTFCIRSGKKRLSAVTRYKALPHYQRLIKLRILITGIEI